MGKPIDPRPGQRLCQVRKHREISQGQIAKAIGISAGTIQNYERGRVAITVDRLMELAHALQCEPAELLTEPGSTPPRYRRRVTTPPVTRRASAPTHRASAQDRPPWPAR